MGRPDFGLPHKLRGERNVPSLLFNRNRTVAARVPFSEHKSGDDTTGSIKSRLWADVGV